MRRVFPSTFSYDMSDGGAGARAMRIRLAQLCDGEKTPKERHDSARRKVKRRYPSLVEVFDLIVRNGKNRRESIFALAKAGRKWSAARLKYNRARSALLSVFCGGCLLKTKRKTKRKRNRTKRKRSR